MSEAYIPQVYRDLVKERAAGSCEYCKVPDGNDWLSFHIDHIIPRKHGGPTVLDNLAYACSSCNQHKGYSSAAYRPNSREFVRLFNPRQDDWGKVFTVDESGLLSSDADFGQATISVLRLNDTFQVQARLLVLELGLYPIHPDS